MPPKSKQGAAGDSARRAYADALRAGREAIGGRVAAHLAGQWPRAVVGFDLATGLVADECVRLVTTLAFAVELDAPDLFVEQITWLQRLLDARGYDAGRAVTAVITDMPKAPCAAKVLRSAWMPAPPPESEPAMVSRRSGGTAPSGAASAPRGRAAPSALPRRRSRPDA